MNFQSFEKIFLTSTLVVLMVACANRAQGPTGGPKDEIPPKIVKSVPLNKALNYDKKIIQVFFDENIVAEKINDQVIISPPQKTMPEIRANGKLLTVNFQDDLIDSTTYSIHFGNSIADLNEKNVYKNFKFAFATGSVIDSMGIGGTVISAENLEPVGGILVGVHPAENEKGIFEKSFERITRTDEYGRFTVDNLKGGKYRIYALQDANRDFIYQTGEVIAFNDSMIEPYTRLEERTDTIWKDTISIDTMITSLKTIVYPNDILLKSFKDTKKRQYLVKSERQLKNKFSLIFNSPQDSLPKLKLLSSVDDANTLPAFDQSVLISPTIKNDTIHYWLTDTLISRMDTLKFQVDYLKTDSLWQLQPETDTLFLTVKGQRPQVNLRKKTDTPVVAPQEFIELKTNISKSFDVYRPVIVSFSEPIDSVNLNSIQLSQKIDSTYKSIVLNWLPIDSIGMQYQIMHKWETGKDYKLKMDSAAMISIYGHVNKEYVSEFKIKAAEEYSALKIVLQAFDSLAVLQVLDSKENVVLAQQAKPKGNLFEYLTPGDYFVRLFVDQNQDGIWNTGQIEKGIQPETVYYFNKKMSLRANWEMEESWDPAYLPLLQQKPADLRKKVGTEKKKR